jgi:hypothetical protein
MTVKALIRAKKRPPVLVQASGIVLSTEGGALKRMLKAYKMFIGGPLGNGSQWFPWIHINDEVRAIRFLVDDKKMSGHFNLAAPHPLRNVDFSKALGRAIGTSSFLSVPVFALRVMFGEMADALLASQRAIPKRLLENGFRFSFEKAQTALADLLR